MGLPGVERAPRKLGSVLLKYCSYLLNSSQRETYKKIKFPKFLMVNSPFQNREGEYCLAIDFDQQIPS